MDNSLLKDIRKCDFCLQKLPLSPRPILQFSKNCNITVIGQAPGLKAHESDKPWNDASGDRLRNWLGVSGEDFYDTSKFALMPMSFCYPGKGKSGDLPPIRECAPLWHDKVFNYIENPKITLLVGSYAQNYYLKDNKSLTERCRYWRDYLNDYIVLPHPSPRNNIWLKKNSWFESEVIPDVREYISEILK